MSAFLDVRSCKPLRYVLNWIERYKTGYIQIMKNEVAPQPDCWTIVPSPPGCIRPSKPSVFTLTRPPMGEGHLDILGPNPALEVRNDFIFFSLSLGVILSLVLIATLKIKIFGLTALDYLKPIWYFVLIAVIVVFWQYNFVPLPIPIGEDSGLLAVRISQWIWELAVILSAYNLSKVPNINYGNMFFLGVLYTIIIHGLKASIRYLLYSANLWYLLDQFVLGAGIVMVFAFVLGSAFVYVQKKKIS